MKAFCAVPFACCFLAAGAVFAAGEAVEAGTDTFAAQAAYDRGVKAYEDKSWIQAKVNLALCLKDNPEFPQKKQILMLLAQTDNKIRTEISGEVDAQTVRSIQAQLEDASKALAAGENQKALQSLRDALDKSPVLREARLLMEELGAKGAFGPGGAQALSGTAKAPGGVAAPPAAPAPVAPPIPEAAIPLPVTPAAGQGEPVLMPETSTSNSRNAPAVPFANPAKPR